MKAKKIGRKHKKGHAVAKMSEMAEAVRSAVRQLFDLASADPIQVAAVRDALGTDTLLALSQWCMAVAEDSAMSATLLEPAAWPEPFAALGNNLLRVRRTNRDDQAGFRKAIGTLTLMEAADLLNALRSDQRLEQWKRRRRMDLIV
jgi:hypothetical protein